MSLSRFILMLFLSSILFDANAQRLEFVSGGGPITLQISDAPAGSEPVDATDAGTRIFWDADLGTAAKLVVSTIAPSQHFRLFVELRVTSYGSGSVADMNPEVELVDGMFDEDLLTNIQPGPSSQQGTGTLVYRASARVGDGNSMIHGDDTHTITYTLLAQ